MVCEWGMSEAMGPLTFGKKEEQIFLGREIAQHQDYSEDTALRIDQEVKRLVTDNYARAEAELVKHKQQLLDMAEALLARETLDADQVKRLVAGEPLGEVTPAQGPPPPSSPPPAEDTEKERPGIVPPIPPRPLTQE
jgi:cell division protease FtsH